MTMFDKTKADLKRLNPQGTFSLRHFIAGLLSQGFQAILVYRFFNWLYYKGIPSQPFRFLCERFIEITTGISIPACCRIGKGLRIHHFGGIIFHPTTQIGENCTLYHGVTIGDRGGSGGAAIIGNNVLIGAGAKILGELTIGDNCVISANAVITKDVPTGHIISNLPGYLRKIPENRQASFTHQEKPASIPRIMDLRGTYKGGGGPDKTILNSAALHNKDNVQVLVTYLRRPSDPEFQIPAMAALRGINYTDLIDRRILDLKCLCNLRQLICRERIQIIHTHDEKTLLYGCLLKWIAPGIRLLHTCHSLAEYERDDFDSPRAWLKYCWRKRMQLILMKYPLRSILTISHNTRQRLIREGLNPKIIRVLPNGIDVDSWNPRKAYPVLRRELGMKPGELLIGTVARITYDKDLPTFYEVSRRLIERFPLVHFVIVGDGHGDELIKARAEVKRLRLDHRIYFTGHRNDLNNIYVSFDLFLMTSRTEGMPNTVLEAMALERPVVSTEVGGVPEIVVDGQTGFLCSPGDSTALTEAVSRLLKDENLRIKFGRAARQRIKEQFNFTARTRILEDVYAWTAGAIPSPPAIFTERS